MKKALAFLLIAAVVAVLAGCGRGAPSHTGEPGKLSVAVTIVPEKTFVEAVGKDLVHVVSMVPPGSSPESYEPTAGQMLEFDASALYFAAGMPVETASLLERAKQAPGMKVVRLQDEVAKQYRDREFAPGERDPHIWLSPKRAGVMVTAIARELASADPAHKSAYEANAKAYLDTLANADTQIKAILAGTKGKTFIVYHPAFGYFADDYGLAMVALEEEGKESTPQHLQEMIDLAKSKGIKTVFYQEEVDSRQADAFADEIGGKAVRLEPLAADYTDNLISMAKAIAEGAK